MNTEFNDWWDKDLLTEDNPYVEGTPAYWAWEGWSAGVKAEREACAKVCDEYDDEYDVHTKQTIEGIAMQIRAKRIK